MEFLVTTNTDVKFTSTELTKATKEIFKLGDSIKRNWFNIAAIVNDVDTNKYYEVDGFANVHEWTEKTFGLKKSASYTLLTIGKEYIRTLTDAKGHIKGYASNLTDDANNDFSKSQIERIIPAGHDVAVDLVAMGEISPDMSVRAIDKVIKGLRTPEPETESTEPESESAEPESESTEPESESTEPNTVELADVHGIGYIVPLDIFEKYVKPYKE